jgi:peptide/nickel transport system ATP-binding protein/oligopeptide transport system ATP-binding protein
MTTVLVAEDLSKSFVVKRNVAGRVTERFAAVRHVSFELAAGETVALVGESGAGKSTVGRLVLRLVEPDSGTVRFLGEDCAGKSRRELRALRSRMRIIFQDPYSSLDPTIGVADAVAEPLVLHTDLSKAERRSAVRELFRRVGLGEHHLDRYPYEFSGGQLQRIAIARAIAPGPDLVVCDEPVAALDMSVRAQVVNLLRDIQEERGIAYLFITHDLSLVRLIADRVAVMYQGEIVEMGRTASIFEDPQHPYTRALLDAVPIPDPSARRVRRSVGPLDLSFVARPTGCAFVDRCPIAMPVCATTAPGLFGASGDHVVACHAVNDIVPAADAVES